jgi:hypothetical protein
VVDQVDSVQAFGKKKVDGEEDWMRELMDLGVGKFCVPLKVSVWLGSEIYEWMLKWVAESTQE